MTPKEFVEGIYKEKNELLKIYLANEQKTEVGKLSKSLKLMGDDKETLTKIVDLALTDSLYTLLLGLDGAGSLGGRQETYRLFAENGEELTGGEIEGSAWFFFHGN